jgi:hypothetical protein
VAERPDRSGADRVDVISGWRRLPQGAASYRVETALVLLAGERPGCWPAGPQTTSNARSASDNRGSEGQLRQALPAGRRTSGDRPESSLKGNGGLGLRSAQDIHDGRREAREGHQGGHGQRDPPNDH